MKHSKFASTYSRTLATVQRVYAGLVLGTSAMITLFLRLHSTCLTLNISPIIGLEHKIVIVHFNFIINMARM